MVKGFLLNKNIWFDMAIPFICILRDHFVMTKNNKEKERHIISVIGEGIVKVQKQKVYLY